MRRNVAASRRVYQLTLDASSTMRYLLALPVLARTRVILVLAALALAVPADASKPRLRLERIDASSFETDGTVRVYASVVELEGSVDDGRAGPSFQLKMNGKSLGRPDKAQQFQGAAEPLDLVLIVESSALYGPKKIVAPPPPPPGRPRARAPRRRRASGRPLRPGRRATSSRATLRPCPPARSRSTRSRTPSTRCSRASRRACACCSSTTART